MPYHRNNCLAPTLPPAPTDFVVDIALLPWTARAKDDREDRQKGSRRLNHLGQRCFLHAGSVIQAIFAWSRSVQVTSFGDAQWTDIGPIGRIGLGEANVILAADRLRVIGTELEAHAVVGVPAGQATFLLGGARHLAKLRGFAVVNGASVLFKVGGVAQRREGASWGDVDCSLRDREGPYRVQAGTGARHPRRRVLRNEGGESSSIVPFCKCGRWSVCAVNRRGKSNGLGDSWRLRSLPCEHHQSPRWRPGEARL